MEPGIATTPATIMIGSVFDSISWRSWLIQMATFVLASLTLFITLILASFPEVGFPCFYGTIVDYNSVNTSKLINGVFISQRYGDISPTLFFETSTTVAFFYMMTLGILILACYLITAALMIRRELRSSSNMRGSASRVSSMISPPATILLGTLAQWLLQASIVLLAHKLIVLAAIIYIAHFFILSLFCIYFTCLGITSSQYSLNLRAIKTANPRLHGILGPTRAVMVNIVLGIMGLSIATTSLMVGMIIANSFHITLWQTTSVAIGIFVFLAIIYVIFGEVMLSYYIHVLPAPAFSIIIACGAMGVTANDYFDRFYVEVASQHQSIILGTKLALAIVASIAVIMLVIRCVRACLYHRGKQTNFYDNVQYVKANMKNYIGRKRGRSKQSKLYRDKDLLLSDAHDDEVIYDSVTPDEYRDSFYK
ncbi:envelope glycoprotein M [Felid alphaherpesvirus 1]|nr:envelope glycoprotein M [Felid alphaherpesvirus 1]AVW80892.1 envelope glycoprotein M [Felid alphaherpesvirus 1]AVW81123.1 envelope glycoprotein M [Felid alphaherpesvirus 1]AVW81893.1 envelope glycoprotein M [Felid alphaherpesvirus 1]